MVEFVKTLVAWYNVIYTLPLLLMGLYLLLHAIGSEWGHSGEPGFGEIGWDSDETEGSSRDSPLQMLWGFLHVGELPFMMVFGIALLTWGILGNAVNRVLVSSLGTPRYLLILSVPITLLGSLGLTKLSVEVITHLFPTATHLAISQQELVGRTAIVLSAQVDARQGRARVKDFEGNPITIFCRAHVDDLPKQGDEVLLVDYDPQSRLFEVEKLDVS